MDFQKLEQDVKDAIHGLITEAESHEPAIDDMIVEALGAVGAPGAVATVVGGLVNALLDHFKNDHAEPAPAPEPAADPEPAAEPEPVAEPEPAEDAVPNPEPQPAG